MLNSRLIVDVMRSDDLAAVTALAAQLGYPNSTKEIESRFAALIETTSDEARGSARHALFVAREQSGPVVGWVHIAAEPLSLLVSERCELMALVVDERYRSLGIGKALVARAEDWACENRYDLIRVRSGLQREAAHRFYLREGYASAKTSKVFTKSVSSHSTGEVEKERVRAHHTNFERAEKA